MDLKIKNKNGAILRTKNKYCEDDIVVTLDSSLIPSGNIEITNTDEVDVTNYAIAQIVDENLTAENIAENVTVLGVTGTFRGGIDTSDGDVTAGDILAGKVAYAKEERIVGTIETYDYSNSEEVTPEIDKLLEASVTEIYNDRVTLLHIGFGKQKSLEKVNFPNVTSTANDTFSGCTSLVEVQMPKCKSIGISAFRSATALEYLSLPSLTTWNSTPFYVCSKLKTLRLKSMQELKGAGSFQECKNLSDIYLGYDGLVTLSATSVLKSSNTATTQGYINIHVKPQYADQYTDATNWTDLIASGFVKIIGDYEEVD